jgi:hypothetical protein
MNEDTLQEIEPTKEKEAQQDSQHIRKDRD